jgi:ATP-dependent helicase/nuclease subunit A
MNARVIPDLVRQVQIDASNPAASAWVAANAGSGKTHVLAQRVIRLMLEGADPAKILCLTFTKAAAANMANRIFETLAKWIALDDDALDDAMENLEGESPSGRRRERARRLFAQALDTPGGLKVQTIHAFCTRLLHQFPFEADVAARFTVLEERAENDLMARLRLAVLLDAAAAPESPLGRALSTAITVATDRTFAEAIDEAIGARDQLTAWIAHAGSIANAMAELSLLLGVGPNETVDEIETAMVGGPIMPASEWAAVAAVLKEGASTDRDRAESFAAAATATGPTRVDRYLQVFFNVDETPRQRLVTKAMQTNAPMLAARLCEEQRRLVGLVARRRAVRARERTAALVTVADAVIGRYRAEKDRRGLLDYDDLIDKTLALMNKVDAAWVHYKLDLGIDHVLIDEAQDTSPKQWEIVKRLAAEFTAGAGARSVRRTMFAVGDEKQSIFSFQGAAPGEFAAARLHFQHAHRETEIDFIPCRFSHSFRSGTNVLGAVDKVFARSEIFASITTDADGIVHSALPDASPGMVEIWPLIEAEKRPEIEGWDAPFDQVSDEHPQMKLAKRIAAQVTALRARGCRAGDVLVLVRQRGPLFEAIIRTLKNAGVPVAGADRLILTEHIAVMDLMVLADALLLPDDDLALATVLKSPLFGFDDAQLFDVAYGRTTSLRTALAGHPAFAEIAARLDALAEAARRDTPFAFYARLLGPQRGRRKILARLGSEAADALDEFLNLALAYEASETPSLQGFVAWLRAATTIVKRDMDVAREEVRVMTVHGAKGLEAPIVILADTTTRPAGPRDPRLLALPRTGVAPDTPVCLVWAGTMATDVGPIGVARDRARAAASDEYRRLLYVAMTRTAEHLIVCGAQGLNGKPKSCWYDLVCDALWEESIEGAADHGSGAVRRWYKTAPGTGAAITAATDAEGGIEIPNWLTRSAPAEVSTARAVSPSSAFENVRRVAQLKSTGVAQRQALARGRIVHRLLQGLPDIPSERRVAAARRHLAGAAEFTDAEREALIAEAMALLDDPAFAPLFAPGTRAEIPIVGRIERAGKAALMVSGQIDRLAVTSEAILIADYKIDRPAPRRLNDVPMAYVTQLALYRAVLRQLYGDREVRAALIWTEVPALIELPAKALDDALAALA